MSRPRLISLLFGALLAGTTLEAVGFQAGPDNTGNEIIDQLDPPEEPAASEPPRTRENFRERLRDAHAEWLAGLMAEQAKIDRYQTRNFLGDRVQLEFVTYVVNEIEFVDLIDAGMDEYTQQAGEGYVYCIVDITLNNVSGISKIAHLTQCALLDAEGSRYAPDEDAIFALKMEYGRTLKRPVTFHWRADRLQPEVPVQAQLVFQIPEGMTEEDLGLEIPRPHGKVLVRLEERPEDDSPRVDRPASAYWSLQDGIPKQPKPASIELRLNDWLNLTKSVHVITGIEYQDDLGSRRTIAPEEGIYLRIDSILENPTENERNCKGMSKFVVSAANGRMYRPVRIDVPAKVPAWDTVSMKSFFLLPKSVVDERLDLLVSQPAWNVTEPSPDTYGWINLKR